MTFTRNNNSRLAIANKSIGEQALFGPMYSIFVWDLERKEAVRPDHGRFERASTGLGNRLERR
jgi:hypothetical protein